MPPLRLRAGEVALYHSRWATRGTAPNGSAFDLTGVSADTLRRDAGGAWRILIDYRGTRRCWARSGH